MAVGSADAVPSDRPTVDASIDPRRLQLTRTRPKERRGSPSEDPRRIGRFAITRRLGAGGMSVVYRALDERVDRSVALKLMLEHGSDSARLRREAQALARLSHPNVVEVFEVGEHDGKAYVAMELVDGPPLDRWLRLRRRSAAEIVEVFIQAGQGLAAAHAQGLVHRDFKPGNVLVGADGRVRVVDFGLVREAGPHDASSHRAAEVELSSPSSATSGRLPLPPGWDQSLTRTGAMVGTPAYMSPEQLSGQPAEPASDQFAFCVALYEALFRQHPFVVNDEWSQLPYNVLDGKLQRPRGRHRVPRALFELLVRGLAQRPRARWPSMDALLQELRRRQGRPSLRPGPLAAAGVALAVALWGLHSSNATLVDDGCDEAAETMHATWSPPVRDELRHAWLDVDRPDAADTWARVEPRLGAYVEDWWSLHRDTCSNPTEAPRPATLCLRRTADALATHLQLMASPNDDLLDNAVQMVTRLPAIDRCSDQSRETVLALDGRWQAELDHVDALYNAGQYSEGLEALETLMTRSRLETSPRLKVELELRRGRLLALAHPDKDLGAEVLENAYLDAQSLGLDRPAAEAAIELVRVFGERQHRPSEAARWSGHARAAVEQVGDPLLTSDYLNASGRALRGSGELPAALEQHQRALEIQQQRLPPDSPELAISHFQLGSTLGLLGRGPEGQAHLEQALKIQQQSLGPRHPQVAATYTNLAVFLAQHGRFRDALASYDLALDIIEQAHPNVPTAGGVILINASKLLAHEGRLEEAAAAIRRLLEGYEQLHEADEINPMTVANLRCVIAMYEDDLEEALPRCEQFRDLYEADLAGDHPDANPALVYDYLGRVMHELGRLDEAEANYRQGLEVSVAFRSSTPHPSAFLGVVEGGVAQRLAELLLARGRPEEASRAIEQARAAYANVTFPDHPARVELDVSEGEVLLQLGRLDEARERLTVAAQRLETRTDLVPRSLVHAWTLLALTELAAGDRAKARAHAERAVARAKQLPASMATHAARAWFLLARSLDPAEREQALALARRAQQTWATTAKTRAEHDEVTAWLAEHGWLGSTELAEHG